MNKKILFFLIGAIILAGGIFIISKKSCGKTDTNGIILFYGTGCPHCANVDKYIEENKMKDKVQFTEEEVFFNKCNAKLLEQLAVRCGLPINEIGVPFLWDGVSSACVSGDQDIINYFKAKIEG